MKTAQEILNFYYGLNKNNPHRDDLNKSRTLTGHSIYCPSCEKDRETIRSKYNNKPSERCIECGKTLIIGTTSPIS